MRIPRCSTRRALAILLIGFPNAFAGEESNPTVQAAKHQSGEFEHAIIIGVGGASEIEIGSGSSHGGVNTFVEYEVIDQWLELEVGVSWLAVKGGWEVPVDLLVKKPFQLTRHLELMIGLGPEIIKASGSEMNGTMIGGELALDFMFWPSRHVGLWLEPTYNLVFHSGISHGPGLTGGVIFGW